MGRPFKFEAVLNHRQHLEDSARRVFADAVREWKQAQSRLSAALDKHARYQRAIRMKQINNGSAREIILYYRYLSRLDSEIDILQAEADELGQKKEDKRQELMVTLKDRKVIEKLKEHFVANQDKTERAQEQKLMGEVAISRYKRRQ